MKNVNKYLINFGVALVVIGLAYFAYQGFYNRYWSDDWCYDRDFKNFGVIKTTGLYFVTGEEAIRGWPLNRYGMTLLSGIVSLPGVFGTQIFTAVTIAVWFAVIYWVLSNLATINRVDVPKNILLLFTGFILYYTLYISTDRFQILYWRSGVVPYSYALITALTLLGLITSQMLKTQTEKITVYLVMFVGLFGGGLSEIGAAFLFGGMTLLLLAAWYFKRAGSKWAARSFSLIQIAWAALFAAFIILIVAPSNLTRYTSMQDGPNNFWLVPFLSVKSALFFISNSLKTLPVPHVILFAVFISLSMLAEHKARAKSYWVSIAIMAAVSFLLIIAIQAPTTYLYSAPPDPRGQSLSRFVMIFGIALISWAMGGIIAPRISAKWILVPVIFLLLGYAYTARAIQITTRDYAGFVQRAQIWDERDRALREAEAQGIKQMEVIVIDTKEIGTKDIMRSQEMNGRWVRNCAASYYGMDAIKAKGTK